MLNRSSNYEYGYQSIYLWSSIAGVLLLGLLSCTDSVAQPTQEQLAAKLSDERVVDYSDMGLAYINQDGDKLVAMPLDTQVTMQVSGMLNRVNVRQVFSNPTQDWLDGQYRFPLPASAAIDGLVMHVGARKVTGVIQPKTEAKKTFERAKKAGHRASLLSQERPNIFTTSVANLGPNEQLVVDISYQELVSFDSGRFSLRFPMTITPRYYPMENKGSAKEEDSKLNPWQAAVNAQSVLALTQQARDTANPEEIGIGIKVVLEPGFEVADISSPYHDITRHQGAENQYIIDLKTGYLPERDFVLNWSQASQTMPEAALFTQVGLTHSNSLHSADNSNNRVKLSHANDAYGMLMFVPSVLNDTQRLRIPRELTLVIDTSGSMSGASIIQAKQAVLDMLSTLSPCDAQDLGSDSHSQSCDRFNLLAFNHQTSSLFSHSQVASSANMTKAKRFISKLVAEGGTEMEQALVHALPISSHSIAPHLKQVVFITDGAVGNEKGLFNLISQRLGEHRLFTVGIGSAPNSFFMERAAKLGRGSFTYIGKVDEVKQKIQELSDKISRPALTDILVTYSDGTVPDYWPVTIGDLYQGEPLLLSLKMRADESRDIWISGTIAGQSWQRQLSLASTLRPNIEQASLGLDLMWARKQIAHLELNKQPVTADKVKKQVTGLSLKYHLISPYTSLVAVDTSDSSAAYQDKKQGLVVPHAPTGYGQTLPQTSTWRDFYLLVGLLMLLTGVGLTMGSRKWTSRPAHSGTC